MVNQYIVELIDVLHKTVLESKEDTPDSSMKHRFEKRFDTCVKKGVVTFQLKCEMLIAKERLVNTN